MLTCFNLPSIKIRLYHVPFSQSIINLNITVSMYLPEVGCYNLNITVSKINPIIVVMLSPSSKICNSCGFHSSIFGVNKPDFKCTYYFLCVKYIDLKSVNTFRYHSFNVHIN